MGLHVVAGDDVANGAKSGRLDSSRWVHKEVDESPANTRLDHGLNLVVGTIRKIRDSPARINQDFIVKRVDEFREDSEGWRDLRKFFN